MSRIPYVSRADGRYRYRRRIHFRNLISRPVIVALQTADPEEARERSALLSARFAVVRRRLKTMYSYGEDFLTAEEIGALVHASSAPLAQGDSDFSHGCRSYTRSFHHFRPAVI